MTGPGPSRERPDFKISLTLQSTQDSNLNLGSVSANVPGQGPSNVPPHGPSNVPPQGPSSVPPVKGSINDMSPSGY